MKGLQATEASSLPKRKSCMQNTKKNFLWVIFAFPDRNQSETLIDMLLVIILAW